MGWVIGSIAALIAGVILFFVMPFSKTKKSFERDVQKHSEQCLAQSGVFSEQEIAPLPEPVQRYFRAAGYIGKPKRTGMTAFMRAVPLKDSKEKPPMIVDYTLRVFVHTPVRLAYIKTSMFGIPFEAYDSSQNGVGFMKGALGKLFTLFNQTGPEMDKGQLLTFLGECPLLPSAILGEYITWEPIDANHAKATIACEGVSGSGIFTFSDTGFVQSFTTDERGRIGTDGSTDYPGWSIVYEDYAEENGVYIPKSVQAVWHEDDGDLVYFDAKNFDVTFD